MFMSKYQVSTIKVTEDSFFQRKRLNAEELNKCHPNVQV